MSSSRGKKAVIPTSKKKKGASSSSGPTTKSRYPFLSNSGPPNHDPWELFFGIIEPAYFKITMELCSMFHLQTVMTNYDDPGTVQFFLGRLVRQLSVPEFVPGRATYNPSHSKGSALPLSLSTAAQESSLTLIGQMSPQGISSMLSMRMIERRRETYPPQYRLAQSTEEEAYEDIPNNVPPQHEDPATQPPPPSRPVHTVASYADISERLT
ncbi:hypothetical protein GOBAR_AA33662 [Gossypium barbadense]|uniref:Uncharacterized protein n=1 Tax=Gossypium barbadense TaxID=3634 RepID=A0A2P5W7J1_GOSBA|nr:hypothetical protein GOBAR_AA33662 [Gossypium barbadense]